MAEAPPLRDTPGRRWPRVALLALLIGLHAALLLLPRQRVLRYRQEPLSLTYLPQPAPNPKPREPAQRRAPPRAAAALPITLPSVAPTPQLAPNALPRIDWDSEASVTAEHQSQLANAPQPRSLDEHKGHHHQEGVGLNSHEAPQFGWNETAIHRFDTRGEIPIVRLSDRCILPLGPFIPLPMCGFGKKIEPRGDLFEHLRDAPAAAPPP